uniref:Pleiotropic regulator 1 n=2 Tax=Tetraselmis sp. GSL018 TaxID=582737 RepID=A0A061R0C8_9CHLO
MATSFAPEVPVEGKTVKALVLLSMKRTHDLFSQNQHERLPSDSDSQRVKIACKIRDEFEAVKQMPPPDAVRGKGDKSGEAEQSGESNGNAKAEARAATSHSATAKLIDSVSEGSAQPAAPGVRSGALVLHKGGHKAAAAEGSKAVVPLAGGRSKPYMPSAEVAKRLPSKWPKPEWHAPWKLYRVISGHLGWVRCVAFDPTNEWFVTGSADRTIKIWDTASGQLKITLTGHIEQVTSVAVSSRHPYMFSAGLDKQVKCWDLEYNKVIRHYHGHLSGIYALSLHPSIDLIMTGGRDSTCRVWDMRTKLQVHCLTGHDSTVCSILSQGTDPQVITGSHDSTIRLWDLRRAKTATTLTYHKKSVRAMAMHPKEYAFASASADNIKKFKLPSGDFLHNMLQNQKTIVNSMALNEDGVLVTGGDNGSLWFWDWRSGNCFQREQAIVQPGSLESEAGIFSACFDVTGSRLVTVEADKTIKMWKQDESATPETHPVIFRPPREIRRY